MYTFIFKNILRIGGRHYTVVPLMRDHKESPQKTVSQKGFTLFGG